MLARAERKRLSLGADVELRQMDVSNLAFEDQLFDAAVATSLFCVLPDDLQLLALREIGRVVKFGARCHAEGHHAAVGAMDRLGLWSRI
jgi:ubiquinone/menaquinone biosynthesis C-methylase UbiE